MADGVHEDHETAKFREVALLKKLRIKNEITGVQARRPDVIQTLEDIDSMRKIINQTTDQQIGRITEMFNGLISQLEKRRDELIKDIREKTATKIERINRQTERLDLDLKDLDNSVFVSSLIVDEASDDHVQQLCDQVMEHLIELEKEESFTDPPVELKRLELDVPNPIDLSVFLNTSTIIEVVQREAPVKVPREPRVHVGFFEDFDRKCKKKTFRKLVELPSLSPPPAPEPVVELQPEQVVEAPAPEPQPERQPQPSQEPQPEPVVEALAPDVPVVEAPTPAAVPAPAEQPQPEPVVEAQPVVEVPAPAAPEEPTPQPSEIPAVA